MGNKLIERVEKTDLERSLEIVLYALGMPLGERIYSGDINFQAEIDDIINPQEKNVARQLLKNMFGVGTSTRNQSLSDSKRCPFLFDRYTSKNGYEVEYSTWLSYEDYKKGIMNVSKEEVDSYIREGKFGYEWVGIDFNPNKKDSGYPLVGLEIEPDSTVKLVDFILGFNELENEISGLNDEDFQRYNEWCEQIRDKSKKGIIYEEVPQIIFDFLRDKIGGIK